MDGEVRGEQAGRRSLVVLGSRCHAVDETNLGEEATEQLQVHKSNAVHSYARA
jgi:phage FluMu protein Com